MARPIEAPTMEVVQALADFVNAKIPRLSQVLTDFPEVNQVLKYPSVSISMGPSDFTEEMPYVYQQPAPVNNASDVKYVVGFFSWSLQVDLWERTKEQRHDLFQDFFVAFHGDPFKTGINLALKKYHNAICNYFMTSFSHEDSEAGSQRKEWRDTIRVTAMSRAILSKKDFIITQVPEVTLDIPDAPIIP